MDTELHTIRDELMSMRAAHVKSENERYDKIMSSIVSEAIDKFDANLIKENLKTKLRTNYEYTKITAMYTVELDELFVKSSYTKDVITPTYWFKYRGKIIKYNLSRDFIDSVGSKEAFTSYLYTSDPHIGKIRKLLYDSFPAAHISQFFYIHPGNTVPFIRFEISYDIGLMDELDDLRVVLP